MVNLKDSILLLSDKTRIFMVFMQAVLKPPENKFVAEKTFIQINIM